MYECKSNKLRQTVVPCVKAIAMLHMFLIGITAFLILFTGASQFLTCASSSSDSSSFLSSLYSNISTEESAVLHSATTNITTTSFSPKSLCLSTAPRVYRSLIETNASATRKEAKTSSSKGKPSGRLRKPRAVVHVGPHKTGTTTIQAYLTDNKQGLANNYSVYFLKDCSKAGAFFVNMYLHKHPFNSNSRNFLPPNCKTTEQDYLKQIKMHSKATKNPSTIVISSENMETLNKTGFVILRDLLLSYDVEIVYYYREAVSRMYSMFMEASKWGDTRPYLYFDEWRTNRKMSRTYRSDVITLKLLSEVFGRKAITVVDYDGALAHGIDPHQVFACDILQTCQLPFKHALSRSMLYSAYPYTTPPSTIKKNVGGSMIGAQLFGVFYNMSVSMKCKPNMTQTAMLRLFRKQFNKVAEKAPTINGTANEQLIALSHKTDANVRANFGPLLYGKKSFSTLSEIFSKTVARKSAGEFSYLHLDRDAFTTASQMILISIEAVNAPQNVKQALVLLKAMKNKYLSIALKQKAFYGCKI